MPFDVGQSVNILQTHPNVNSLAVHVLVAKALMELYLASARDAVTMEAAHCLIEKNTKGSKWFPQAMDQFSLALTELASFPHHQDTHILCASCRMHKLDSHILFDTGGVCTDFAPDEW